MFACGKFGDWFLSTAFGEFLSYLKTKYFSIAPGDYEHLPATEDFYRSLEILLFAFALGIVVAVVAYLCHRALASRLLTALEAADATENGKAKTLDELGLSKRRAIRRLLGRPSLLSRKTLVASEKIDEAPTAPEQSKEAAEQNANDPSDSPAAEDPSCAPAEQEAPQPDQKPNPSVLTLNGKELASARLFLPKEDLDLFKERYRRRGHPALIITATVVLSTVALSLLMRLLPFVLGLVDTIL